MYFLISVTLLEREEELNNSVKPERFRWNISRLSA